MADFVRANQPGVCDRCDRVYSAGTVLLRDALGVRCNCTERVPVPARPSRVPKLPAPGRPPRAVKAVA